MAREGISRRLTIPQTPQQNGVAERMNRTLVEMARCLLFSSKLSAGFWADAVVTACHIRNRCPSCAIDDKIPYEKFFERPVKIHYLRSFGSKVYVLDKDTTKDKFAPRSKQGVFVGYPRDRKGYRVWLPHEHKLIIARDVRFLKNERSEDAACIDPFLIADKPKEGDPIRYIELDINSCPILPSSRTTNPVISPSRFEYRGNTPTSSEIPLNLPSDNVQIEVRLEDEIKRAPGRPRIQRGQVGRPKRIYRMVSVSRMEQENEGELIREDTRENDLIQDVDDGRQRQGIEMEEEECDIRGNDTRHDENDGNDTRYDEDDGSSSCTQEVFTDCEDFVGSAAEVSLREALYSEERKLWESAIVSEIRSLVKNWILR